MKEEIRTETTVKHKESSLSDHREGGYNGKYYMEEKVREAVRRLKQELSRFTHTWLETQEVIDKIFGGNLT